MSGTAVFYLAACVTVVEADL